MGNIVPMGVYHMITNKIPIRALSILHKHINKWATLYQWVYQHDNQYNTDKSITNIIQMGNNTN